MNLLDHLPAPLHNRATQEHHIYALFATGNTAQAHLQALLEGLCQLSPLPAQVHVYCQGQPPAQWQHPACTLHNLADPASAAALAQAEAALLPHTLWDQRHTLAALAIPTVLDLGAQPPAAWDAQAQGGLAVAGASPQELAALLVQLATDPATRRCTLDGQAPWEPPSLQRHWRVEGVFDSSYSLAIVNRHLAMALQDAGLPASLYTYEQGPQHQPPFANLEDPARLQHLWQQSQQPLPPAVALRNAWPPVVRDMRGQRRALGNYAWEETEFPPQYVADFNRTLDLITVVSRQTRDLLQNAGVSTPMALVGNGIDHLGQQTPEPLPTSLPAGYRFLHISSCFPRKGVDVLLRAYGDAYRAWHDVVLIIKTFPNPHNTIEQDLAALQQADPDFPQVHLLQDDWTPGQIVSLYQACQAFVLPSRGEGFGLPAAEAMLHQLPVIATGWGGHTDFCTPQTAWLVRHTLQPAQSHMGLPGSLWAEPDRAHLAELLETLPHLPADALRQRTQAARQQVQANYTWAGVAQRTRQALEHLNQQPGPQRPPRVGWFSTWGTRCGIAAYSAHMVRALAPEQLHIFAPTETPETPDPAHVHRCWQQGQADMAHLVQQAQTLQIDVFVLQHHWGFLGAQALASLVQQLSNAGISVVVEFHNTRSAPPDIEDPAALQALAQASRLIVHSLDDLHRLHRWGLQANSMWFPLAVYPVALPTPDQQTQLRHTLGLQDKRILATYGFLMPHKGLFEMVQAMPALLREHPNAHLLMVNAWYSEPASAAEQSRLEQAIQSLGLAAHVTLDTRFLPEADCAARLSLAEVVVFPYQNTEESASAAVRMALATGSAIATTPLPIFSDVAAATHPLPGTTAPELAQGLAQLLHSYRTPQALAQARQRASQHAHQQGATQLANRLAHLLRGLHAQRSMPAILADCGAWA
jgi:glycosyltransferase involved in cell wall biosynthesis